MAFWLRYAVLGGVILFTSTAAAVSPPAVYMLELTEPAAVKAFTEAGAGKGAAHAGRRQLAAVAAQQARVRNALRAKADSDTAVLYQVQRAYNGIALQASEEAAAGLHDLAEVRTVHRLRPVRLLNATSMPFIGVPEVWAGADLGVQGTDVSIGIVDTGIDYLHPAFGGDPDDHADNDTAVVDDGLFPTAKVAGGYDFVGDNYDPEDSAHSTPIPDPDPMDQHGHGTHVAGIAGGFGVRADGTPYNGPYVPEADLDSLLIGPGAAPAATLYALKVFGTGRESFVVLPAIDWALDPNGDGDFSDRLDVINLSVGDIFGDTGAPVAQAAANVAAADVVVVAAAGNGGDVYFVHSAPGVAPDVIAVAASEDDDPAFSSTLSPDRLSGFSSRGPALDTPGFILKPDLSAPGRNITSARLFNPDRPDSRDRLLSGTSMAAPHVAGVAALLRELHPDWPAAAIKALLMNTALHDVLHQTESLRPRIAPDRAGAGRVDAARAAATDVIAYDAAHPGRVSITFATREVMESMTEQRTLRIENRGAESVAFDLGIDLVLDAPGLEAHLEPDATARIQPGGTVDIGLAIQANPARMRRPRDPARRGGVNEFSNHWLSPFSGYITCTPAGAQQPALRVPFYAVMRPVADMRGDPEIDVRTSSEASLTFSGTSVYTGDTPDDIRALVTPFALLEFDENEPGSSGPRNLADLKYVGVSSDIQAAEAFDEARLYFGIATWGDWESLNQVRFVIRIDIDKDGAFDYAAYTTSDVIEPVSDFVSDSFVVRLSDFGDNHPVQGPVNYFNPALIDSNLFGNNVLVMPVKVADLGLTRTRSDFAFRVETLMPDESDTLVVIDESAVMRYNAMAPGLAFPMEDPGLPHVFATEDTALAIDYNPTAFAAGTKGLLLLHHHNARGNRAEWLGVITDDHTDTDGDGIPDAVEGGADADNDGRPNLADPDSDGDGISDIIEGTEDVDGDGVPNFLDLDSDGDTLPDAREWIAPRTDPYNPDTDQDGIRDDIDGLQDTDGDGTINALDRDSDDDGIPDAVEGTDDIDNDGVPNFLDLDSDDDGLSDEAEVSLYETEPYNADTDGDGRPDGREVAQGTDPNEMDPPVPPDDVAASAGTFARFVRISWSAVPGAAEYQVYRAPRNNLDEAFAVSNWTNATSFDDAVAAPARRNRALCGEAMPEVTAYTYWVRARNDAGESLQSNADTGWRGLPGALSASTMVVAAVAACLVLSRRRR